MKINKRYWVKEINDKYFDAQFFDGYNFAITTRDYYRDTKNDKIRFTRMKPDHGTPYQHYDLYIEVIEGIFTYFRTFNKSEPTHIISLFNQAIERSEALKATGDDKMFASKLNYY